MLHESYRPLLEQGMTYWAATQPEEKTLKRLQGGESFFAFLDDLLVGTITVVEEEPGGPCDWYNLPEVNHFSQFCVRLQQQGKGLGNFLMNFIEDDARARGIEEMAMDTSERADKLIEMYKRRNYRFIQKAKWENTNYESVVYSKRLV
jgi:GNAT superfamily N-acetyltransferase